MAKKTTAMAPVRKVAKKAPSKAAAKSRPGTRATSAVASAPSRKSVTKKAARPAVAKSAKTPRARSASADQVATPAPVVPVPPEVELVHVDEQLLALLNKRASLYLQKMQGVKTPSKIVFSDLDQQQVWGLIDRSNQGPLSSAELKTIFRPLMSAGRQRIRSIRAAYLGPAYSFTHQAAISRFGEAADLVPVSTIATVFEEVNRGHVDFGLVPIENSTDGRIVDTLDMYPSAAQDLRGSTGTCAS